MTILVKKPLPEQILELIRERIVSGAVAADAPIRQDTLAAELGVSKIPLREALGRLEQDGLIISQANRGFFVSPLTSEEALDVFDLRLRIEPDAIGEAAICALDSDRETARRCLDALNDAIAAGSERSGPLNREFHTALIRPCGRKVTIQIVERLQVTAERYVRRHLELSNRQARATQQHEALFAAWESKDSGAATILARDHIRDTLEDLRLSLG